MALKLSVRTTVLHTGFATNTLFECWEWLQLWFTSPTLANDHHAMQRSGSQGSARAFFTRDEVIEKMYSASKRIFGLKVKLTAQLLTVFNIISDEKYFSLSIYIKFVMYIFYFDFFLIEHPRIRQNRATVSRFRFSSFDDSSKNAMKAIQSVQLSSDKSNLWSTNY